MRSMKLPQQLGPAQLQHHPNQVWEYRFDGTDGKPYMHIYVQLTEEAWYVRLVGHEVDLERDRPTHYFTDRIDLSGDVVEVLRQAYNSLVDLIKKEQEHYTRTAEHWQNLAKEAEAKLALLNDAPTLWSRLEAGVE
jgi:hypothetical protein